MLWGQRVGEKLGGLCLLFIALATKNSWGLDSFCYIPGAMGGDSYVFETEPALLAKKGIPFKSFDVGYHGSVRQRADKLRLAINEYLKKDPSLKCHMIGYSMGGLTMRFAMSHLNLDHPTLGTIPFRSIVLSQTTASSPHLGTPLSNLLGVYSAQLDEGLNEMSEENVARFNDPKYIDTYSPLIDDIPAYSYGTYLINSRVAFDFLEKLGFGLIGKEYAERHLDPKNDGVVPTLSQHWGAWIDALPVGHGYFGPAGRRSDPAATEVWSLHWSFVNHQTADLQKVLDERPAPPPMIAHLAARLLEIELKTDSALSP